MEHVLAFLREFNFQNILSMAVIMWYFTRDLKASIEQVDHDLMNMNTRISRLEGTVYGSDIYNKIKGD